MKLLSLIFIGSILLFSACTNEETLQLGSEDCTIIENATILAPEDLPCNYNEVYFFEGKLYTTCVCCACFKVSIAMDCDGEPLCEDETSRDCMDNFYKNATYLYAIEEF